MAQTRAQRRRRSAGAGFDPGSVQKQVDALLRGDDSEAAALIIGAVDDFAGELASVLERFLQQKNWKNTERVVIGGGFREAQ